MAQDFNTEPRMKNKVLEGVRLIFRNFAGKEGPYNTAGNRNFTVILDEQDAQEMQLDGWNVKELKKRDEQDPTQWSIEVTVGYKGKQPPRAVMISGDNQTELGEEEINTLDYAVITNADLILRPYEWEVNGKSGVKAYLKSIYVTVEEDELERKYAQAKPTTPRSGPSFDDEDRPF